MLNEKERTEVISCEQQNVRLVSVIRNNKQQQFERDEKQHAKNSTNPEEASNSWGFYLTRGKWDPYPWISAVDEGSDAFDAGLRPGDCLIEVNGEDVLGRRVKDVGRIVKSAGSSGQVSLLVWNPGVDPFCTAESICCGPMPTNLQRLSACMSSILTFLECPICLDTIPPPTYQCDNGHLLCMRCRTKSERCPVCRVRLQRGHSLFADQVYTVLVDAFNLKDDPGQNRSGKIQQIFQANKRKEMPNIKITHTNKFLAKLYGKSSSVDNVSIEHQTKRATCSNSISRNEFESNMRMKSLSSNEIYQEENSPINSQRNGSTKSVRNERFPAGLSPNNYYSSYESIAKKFCEEENNDFGHLKFNCPFSNDCKKFIIGNTFLDHFKSQHDGPLIQYFKPNFDVSLRKYLHENHLSYLVHFGESSFFVKMERVDHERDQPGEDLFWSWIAGTKKVAKNYLVEVKIVHEDGKVIFSARNAVCSLNADSYRSVIEESKGNFFKRTTLESFLLKEDAVIRIQILNDSE